MLSSFPVVLLETMSHYTDEPRFTIEQIDLLQRLRRTGMTKHEILHALETLDRLDQEHSDKFGRRSSYGGSSYGNSTNNVPASSSTATASTQTQHSGMSPSPSNSYDTSPQPCTTNQNGRENSERLSTSNGKMSLTRYHANSMGQRSYSFEASEEDLDVDDKVEELMRRDSSVIKEEIKAFLANRRISQAVVAQVTGISQSRISHWLLQQGSDLSEQKKRAFYRWYQLEKTNPVTSTRINTQMKQREKKLPMLAMRLYRSQAKNCLIWNELPPSKYIIGLLTDGRRSRGEPILQQSWRVMG